MHLKFIFLIIIFVAGGSTAVLANEAECDALIEQSDFDKKMLISACLEAAKTNEKKRQYGLASWYYFLAGKHRYNIESIAPEITYRDGLFVNAAHSCVMSGDRECAQTYYGAYLGIIDVGNDEDLQMVQNDFAIMQRRFPDQMERIKEGKALWESMVQTARTAAPEILRTNKEIARAGSEGDDHRLITLFQKQLKNCQRAYGELSVDVATLYANMGISYNNLGQYAKAFKYKRKALRLRQQLLEPYDTRMADSYHDMGVAYAVIGDDEKAIQYFLGAVKIREANGENDPQKLAPLYSMLATHLENAGDHESSEIYRKKALGITQKTDNAFISSYALIQQAMAAIGQAHYSQAVAFLAKAETFEQKKPNSKSLSRALIESTYAEAYLKWGKLDKALQHARQALQINQDAQAGFGVIDALNQIGWIYYAQKDFGEAYQYAKEAFDMFMKERDAQFAVLDDNAKNTFIQKSHRLIVLLMESAFLGRTDFAMAMETFNRWLRYKGSIFDSENLLSVVYDQTDDLALKKRIDQLRMNKRKLADLYQKESKDQDTRFRMIQSLREEIHTLTEKLAGQIHRFDTLRQFETIQGDDIADRLGSNDLYVDFARIRNSYFVYTVTADRHYDLYRINSENYHQINRTIRAFRTAIQKGERYSRTKLGQLYDILLRPVIETKTALSKNNLILSPDGLLHLFPFETLYNSKTRKYLLETHTIRYLPNGKELIRLHAQLEDNNRSDAIAVFAYPDYNFVDGIAGNAMADVNRSVKPQTVFVPLPGARAEAEAIRKIFADRPLAIYLEKNATEANLFALKSPEILHISTHGYFIRNRAPNPMLRSAIALSGANYAYTLGKGPGIVTALKLSGMHLRGTGIVVLSACETGMMDADDTESISGLSKAFIVAGAKNVVVSLWSVSDRGTQKLMEEFYREVQDGATYAEALRKAKITMLHKGFPAAIWAPFILNGA